MTADDCWCAFALAWARRADGEDVTVTTTAPDQYTPGAKAWRCPDGNLFYTVPTDAQVRA